MNGASSHFCLGSNPYYAPWFLPLFPSSHLKIGRYPVRFSSYAAKSKVNNPKTWARREKIEEIHLLSHVFCQQLRLPLLSYVCCAACGQPDGMAVTALQTVWACPEATEVCSWSGRQGMEMINSCSSSWATEIRSQIRGLLFSLQQWPPLSSPVFLILPCNGNSAVMLQKDYCCFLVFGGFFP